MPRGRHLAGRKNRGQHMAKIRREQQAPRSDGVERRRIDGSTAAPDWLRLWWYVWRWPATVFAGVVLWLALGRRSPARRHGRRRRQRWRNAAVRGRRGMVMSTCLLLPLSMPGHRGGCGLPRHRGIASTDRVYPPTTLTGLPELGLSSSAQPWALFFFRAARPRPPPRLSCLPRIMAIGTAKNARTGRSERKQTRARADHAMRTT